MGDEAAEQLIDEYNRRLDEERTARDFWIKGDLPGHPFRGNQWEEGQGGMTEREAFEAGRVRVFHGTQEEYISEILKTGLLPRKPGEAASHLPGYTPSNQPKGVYGTMSSPEEAANWAVAGAVTTGAMYQGKSVPTKVVVVEVEVEGGRLNQDPIVGDAVFTYSKIPATKIRSVRTYEVKKVGPNYKVGALLKKQDVIGGELKARTSMMFVPALITDRFETKGDRPGHPFRGNQWGPGRGGSGSAGSSGYGVDVALDVLEGRQPPNSASNVRRIDPQKIKSDEPLKNGGVNEARVVEIEGEGKFCFKPDSGENPHVHPAYRGHQSANEVAASVIDEEMNLGLVAKTEMAEIGGKTGSLQRWVNDDASVAKELIRFDGDEIKDTSALDSAEGVSDMMHYDALIGNTDRHFGNWLVKDGRVQLIDNGMSMADNMEYGDPSLRYRSMEHMGGAKRAFQKMSPKFKEGLGRLLNNRERTDAKLEAAGVGAAQRASFWKRAEFMLRAGRLGFGDGTLKDLGRLSEGLQLF